MLSSELRDLIGRTLETSLFVVDKESIRRFADAVGDLNPMYLDEQAAEASRFGSIVAPPGFLSSLWLTGRSMKGMETGRPGGALGPPDLLAALERSGFKSVVDTGMDYEFLDVVKAGDKITSTVVLKHVAERSAKEGKVAFVVTETTFENQLGKIVARARSMTAHQRPAGESEA